MAFGLTLNKTFFPHLNLLNYYVSTPMEQEGQYVRLSAIGQVGRPCSAPGMVTRGSRECQGPVWSPGGQLPYEYIKDYCKPTCEWHVNYLQPPPPPLSC